MSGVTVIFKCIQYFCLIILVSAGLNPLCVLAQDQIRHDRVQFSASEGASEFYVAIMGAIETPGTYHVDSTSLKLRSVVQRAGGFTADASKTIRIIRRGQSSSQKMIYSETGSDSIIPGDLLIAESRQRVQNASKVVEVPREASETVRASYEAPQGQSGIQIALLNLLDYPVVVTRRPEESSPAQIVEWLGHPIELLQHTRIITSDVSQRQWRGAVKQTAPLNDGTVLAFESRSIDRKRLPANLPKPIESDIAAGARSSLFGMAPVQSMELHELGQQVFKSTLDGAEINHHEISAPLPPTSHPGIGLNPVESEKDRKDHRAPSIVRSRAPIAVLPGWKGDSRITNSSAEISKPQEQPISEPIPEPDDAKVESNASSLDSASPLTFDEELQAPQASLSAVNFAGILLIASVFVGIALWLRQTLEANSNAIQFVMPQSRVEPVAESIPTPQVQATISTFDQLLKNELPIEFEDVEIPSGINLQGRVVEKPILRLDAAQASLHQHGPHFPIEGNSAAETPAYRTIASVDSPEPTSIRRPHFIAARQRKVALSNDAADDANNAVTDDDTTGPARPPLAKALFKLEKGARP